MRAGAVAPVRGKAQEKRGDCAPRRNIRTGRQHPFLLPMEAGHRPRVASAPSGKAAHARTPAHPASPQDHHTRPLGPAQSQAPSDTNAAFRATRRRHAGGAHHPVAEKAWARGVALGRKNRHAEAAAEMQTAIKLAPNVAILLADTSPACAASCATSMMRSAARQKAFELILLVVVHPLGGTASRPSWTPTGPARRPGAPLRLVALATATSELQLRPRSRTHPSKSRGPWLRGPSSPGPRRGPRRGWRPRPPGRDCSRESPGTRGRRRGQALAPLELPGEPHQLAYVRPAGESSRRRSVARS